MSDFRSYLDQVKKLGQLSVVKRKVSTKYEIAAVTAKMDGGNAVLFDNIKESRMRLVANLVGNRQRFARAINAKDSTIHEKVISAINHPKKPRIISGAKFFENSSRDLNDLPIVTHFQKESGPFITSSIIYAKNPETGEQNSSFHRLMPIDKTHFSVRMVEGRHLHRTFLDAKEHGNDLDVVITVGVHPAISIAGAYQADWGKDELEIANTLLSNKLTLTKLDSGLVVPSGAEIVMEGKILAGKTHKEWMVEMLRTYDFAREQPVFELKKMHYRNNAIFHDILSGYSEHRLLMGMPIEAKLNRDLKKAFPQTKRVIMSNGGCNWLHAVVQISKKRDNDAKKAIDKTFASHRSLKMVTVVDDDIDPSDPVQIEYAMATRFQAAKNLTVIKKVRGSSLDPSSDQKNLLTSKLGIDATRPLSKRQEGFEIAKIPGEESISLKKYFK